MTTDTTPAALERIMERLREPQSERDMAAAQRDAAAVIAALGAKLHAIAEIATWDERDKDAYIAQGPGLLISDMRRIATIARTVGEKE